MEPGGLLQGSGRPVIINDSVWVEDNGVCRDVQHSELCCSHCLLLHDKKFKNCAGGKCWGERGRELPTNTVAAV